MDDKLHDEIDFREDMRDKTTQLVQEIVKEKFQDALELTGNVTKAMELVALWLENELADLTTEAVRIGYKLARDRNGN
jgi:DNA polymerase III delta prime subunit